MSGIFKKAYETFECNQTCGLPLRTFLRILSLVGMVSANAYTLHLSKTFYYFMLYQRKGSILDFSSFL